MIEFDDLFEETCVVETTPNPTTCQPDLTDGNDEDDDVDPPSDDDRCADPAFAEANPELCAGYPRLILKPETAIVEVGATVQYKTYLRQGGSEQLLSSGLNYVVADPEVGVISASGGLFTGSTPGSSEVSVTWQTLSAFANVQVVEDCSALAVNYVVLLDISKSSKVGFSSVYSSRLAYAKEAAKRFANTTNLSKDKIGVVTFGAAGVTVLSPTDNLTNILSAISGVAATDEKTNIHGGLSKAKEVLEALTGTKVILLFSDGENNEGDDPLLISTPWKEAGRFIVVTALRSWGTHFNLLYSIASNGFFLSAYGATAASVLDTLVNLKSYICSGDCQPTEGTYPMASLNYTGFANWDVYQGAVDLIGLGLWDVLPGNGLYVDLAGTNPPVFPASPGGLRSKVEYSFTAGVNYRFAIKVAGNNVNSTGIDNAEPVKVTIGTMLIETITPTGHSMPFTLYEFEFTPAGNENAKIQIEMIGANANNVGPLIDVVVLENLDTSTVMLSDDFDNENITVIPITYGYGYGCIETPPGAQTADPTPPTPPLPEG